MLTPAQFAALQQYLVQAYAPFVSLFVVGLIAAGILLSLFVIFLVLSGDLLARVA